MPVVLYMRQSQEYLARAENCAQLAEEAGSLPAQRRFRRMEAAWRALAAEQQWLDGEIRTPDGASVDPTTEYTWSGS